MRFTKQKASMTACGTNVHRADFLNWREKIMDNFKEGYKNKIKNRLYGLLCEREKNGEWEKFLDTIVIELIGLPENEKTINYYALLGKIQSLRYLSYEYFRRTVFECMNLIGGIIH